MVHTIDMPGKSRGMTVKRLLTSAAKKLQPRRITCPADRSVGWLEAEILLAHVLQKDRVWLVAHEDEPVHDRPARKFRSLVARRVKREPIAYLTGHKEFYGRDFVVGPHTLIPRPESELFIERLTATLKRDGNYLFCDIGAGSGAIAVTLALEFPRSRVVATDVDAHALQTARVNAARYKVAGRMSFIKEDLLGRKVRHELRPSTRPLVLVANLPYLPDRDKKRLTGDVVDYEPGRALFAGPKGTELIERLWKQIADHLHPLPRVMLFEFDPPQAARLKALAKKMFPGARVNIIKDLSQRNRLLEITRSV